MEDVCVLSRLSRPADDGRTCIIGVVVSLHRLSCSDIFSGTRQTPDICTGVDVCVSSTEARGSLRRGPCSRVVLCANLRSDTSCVVVSSTRSCETFPVWLFI